MLVKAILDIRRSRPDCHPAWPWSRSTDLTASSSAFLRAPAGRQGSVRRDRSLSPRSIATPWWPTANETETWWRPRQSHPLRCSRTRHDRQRTSPPDSLDRGLSRLPRQVSDDKINDWRVWPQCLTPPVPGCRIAKVANILSRAPRPRMALSHPGSGSAMPLYEVETTSHIMIACVG